MEWVINQSKNIKIVEWIFLFLSITDTLAFLQGDTTLRLSFITNIVIVFKYLLLLVSFFILYRSNIGLKFKYLWVPVVIWLVFFLSSIGGKLYLMPLNLILLSVFCILPDFLKYRIFEKYRIWIIVMSSLGILAYLSYIFSLGIPYSLTYYYTGGDNYYYVDYMFSLLYLSGFQVRLCGLFNEPGFFGTVIALILILEKFNLKRIGNIILLCAGFFTFSFAYYILIIIYFLVKMTKSLVSAFMTISVILLLLFYVQNTQFDDPQVQHLVDRFSIDKTKGEFSGDNRTSEEFDLSYQRMFDEGNWFLGMGGNAMVGKEFTTLSYKALIYKHGVLGFSVIMGCLFIAAYPIARRNRDALIFLLCFFISLYQRPNIYTMSYFCLLFGGLVYITLKNEYGKLK